MQRKQLFVCVCVLFLPSPPKKKKYYTDPGVSGVGWQHQTNYFLIKASMMLLHSNQRQIFCALVKFGFTRYVAKNQ